MKKNVAVIGSGFAGMTAAALLAKNGFSVSVFEKNDGPGGRASQFRLDGFTFDKGPSFYWMPDVFERFFNQFNKSATDYYTLKRLDPSYKIFFTDHAPISIPSDIEACKALFETIEPGAGKKLETYLNEAKIKYEVGMGEFVYLPSLSFTEYFDKRLLQQAFKLDLFTSISKHVAQYFSNPYLKQILEFPVLFLGAKPSKTPALFSMMNYADLVLGTWYPEGGMYSVSKAIHTVGVEQGVTYYFNEDVTGIIPLPNQKIQIDTAKKSYSFDIVVSGADYHHTESKLLHSHNRSYKDQYWQDKTFAPSALLYFLGFNRVLAGLEHHSLFFDAPFHQHASEIYDTHQWPKDPLFYTNSSSLTDISVAPAGHHNMVVLIPVSTSLVDTEAIKSQYLNIVLDRITSHTGIDCKKHLVTQRSYAQRDFIKEYNSYKGNAYGMANTLLQTGPLRPKIRSKKIPNLFYCGQLTVPGPGLPPAIISGEIVANYISKEYNV